MKETQNQNDLDPIEKQNNDTSNGEQQPNEVISLVAHELKNPIASIRGYTELLLTGAVGEVNPTQIKFLNTILSNIERMTELVNDLGDTARIDSGSQRMDLTSISPSLVIDEIIDSLVLQFEEKGLLLCTDIPTDLPDIKADKTRIVQVVSNILGNAAKYTLPGGKIIVSAREMKDKIQFAVQDTGIGIKTAHQKDIFQRYYRTEDVHARDIPGTGLGLYITKRLIEMQGGEIWFESEYGKGTTFYFTMNISK